MSWAWPAPLNAEVSGSMPPTAPGQAAVLQFETEGSLSLACQTAQVTEVYAWLARIVFDRSNFRPPWTLAGSHPLLSWLALNNLCSFSTKPESKSAGWKCVNLLSLLFFLVLLLQMPVLHINMIQHDTMYVKENRPKHVWGGKLRLEWLEWLEHLRSLIEPDHAWS